MDTLLRGGRVIDPGAGFDGPADVLISGGRIAAVGQGLAASAAAAVDVTGLVVGPGFVDVHSHVHSIAGHRMQAMDGVTTALDLEAGVIPVERGYAEAAKAGRPLNYGFSASWGGARAKVLLGAEPDAKVSSSQAMLGNEAWRRSSSPSELTAWLSVLENEIAAGALGIGVVVLDPARITDAATYTDPLRPSVGVRHLYVAGTSVVRQGELQADALPGRPLRGEAR